MSNTDTETNESTILKFEDKKYEIESLNDRTLSFISYLARLTDEIQEATYELNKLRAAKSHLNNELKKCLIDETPIAESFEDIPEEVRNMMPPKMKEELKKAAQAK